MRKFWRRLGRVVSAPFRWTWYALDGGWGILVIAFNAIMDTITGNE